jgi:hypothetical protein
MRKVPEKIRELQPKIDREKGKTHQETGEQSCTEGFRLIGINEDQGNNKPQRTREKNAK